MLLRKSCRQQQQRGWCSSALLQQQRLQPQRRLLIASARSRKGASASPAPADDSSSEADPETAAAAAVPAPPPLVRSARRSAAGSARNARNASPRSVSTTSPVQRLREKGILAVDEEGQQYVNVACLAEGKPSWYSLALLENKEDAFISLLTTKLQEYGYTVSPVTFQPPMPAAAAEANEKAAAAAEDALADAEAKVIEAEDLLGSVRGRAGEVAAAAALQQAQADVAAAEKRLVDASAAGAAATEAAAATAPLLEQYDVVVWKPRKKMMVYSFNTDKLGEREVAYSRGTGGATLLLHCSLDPLLADVIPSTYYFLNWRDSTPVSAVLLNQHDLLPEDAELDALYTLPEPCTQDFLQQVATWQHTPESEDLEAERTQYYGTAGGSPFGARPEKSERKQLFDRNNPNRWSVSAGPTNAGAAALIAAGEPLPWEKEQQQQDEAFDRGRGRGRNGRGARGGRGGGRGERQPWQQQQEYGQQQQQERFAPAGQYPRQQGSRDGYDSYDGGYGSWDGGRARGQAGRGRGRGRYQQEQQQQQRRQPWEDEWQQRPKQAQRGYAVAAAGGAAGEGEPGAEDSFSEQNRQKQMDWMDEMGSNRYRDDEPSSAEDEAAYGGRGWQQQQAPAPARQQWQQPQQQPGAGRDGGATRMRQMDFMEDMGSGRYSDDEDDDFEQRPRQQQGRQQQPGAGRDGGTTRMRQIDFMGDMGSGRYSDEEDYMNYDRLEGLDGTRQGSDRQQGMRGSSSSSGNFSSLLSDVVADALEYMDDGSSGAAAGVPSLPPPPSFAGAAGSAGSTPTAGRNNAAWGSPGKASYMDEDTLEWGQESGGVRDEGAAAAQSMLQEWQSQGQAGGGQASTYNAETSTRSREGLGASFEFDAGPGLASADSLLGQLPDAEALAGLQQQQQQVPAEPKRRGRTRKTDAVAPAAADGAAAGSSRRKTSMRKAAAGASKKQKGSAAAAAADVPLEGWVGGADASDEGFEEGWVDRMLDDGNNKTGLDDVMAG